MGEESVPGRESLTGEELAAVVRVVRALVEHDADYLRQIHAFDGGADPYLYTRHWRFWDQVDLIMPPGHPRGWIRGVFRGGGNPWIGLDVDIWTEQEGRSELTLQIDMRPRSDGEMEVLFRSLHVL